LPTNVLPKLKYGSPRLMRTSEVERLFGEKAIDVTKAQLDDLVRQSPGSVGAVIVKFKGNDVGHVFNYVNRDGFVFYPDFQKPVPGFFEDWNRVIRIRFIPMN